MNRTSPATAVKCRFLRRPLWCVVVSCLASMPVTGFAADPNPPSIHSGHGAWPICRQWTVAETHHFAEWLQHIYEVKTEGTHEQQLARLERVLTDPEINALLVPEFAGEGCNEQLDLGIIRAMHSVLDCAKLTVALSTYYAYRRGLPWIASHVRACDGGDLRTCDYTIPAGVVSSFEYRSAKEFFRDAITGTSTGNFRVELNRKNSELSDTLPVAIASRYLIPGCLYYLDGHVLILAKIDAYGEPRFLDATVAASRDIYAFNGFNAVTGVTAKRSDAPGRDYEGCYLGFRVYRWPVAEVDARGEVTRVRRRTDDEMKEFGVSTEQYDEFEELTTNGRIVENGILLDSFHQFVRLRLRSTDRIDLSADLKTFASEMAALLDERERRVQQAWRDVAENGPVPFPEDRVDANVFTAGGRWGQQASALADVGCRAKYFDLMDHIDNAISWFDLGIGDLALDDFNKHAIWSHADLADAVLRAKNRLFADTAFAYADSAGHSIRLSLLDVEKRLYDLSFDPNHPPELRWGASPGSPEAQSAPSEGTPLPGGGEIPMADAYRREAYYRALTQWEPDPSYLRKMFTQGFPVRAKLDEDLRLKWFDGSSPPLVPHNGKAAWLREQAAVLVRGVPSLDVARR